MPRAKQSGSLTGSKHFKKPKDTPPSTPPLPSSTPTPEQQTDAKARERLKDRFQDTAKTANNVAQAVSSGVKAVNHAAKTVQRVSFGNLPKRAIVGALIGLVGLGMLVGHGMRSDAPQVQSPPTTQKSK